MNFTLLYFLVLLPMTDYMHGLYKYIRNTAVLQILVKISSVKSEQPVSHGVTLLIEYSWRLLGTSKHPGLQKINPPFLDGGFKIKQQF